MKWTAVAGVLAALVTVLALTCYGLLAANSQPDTSSRVPEGSQVSADASTAQAKFSEKTALVNRFRTANAPWLNRFGRALLWDVQYTYSAHDLKTGTTYERKFRTVYDRGLDFLPPSERALYLGVLPNMVTECESTGGRIALCRWSNPPATWLWIGGSQYSLPSPFAQLREFPYKEPHATGALDAFFDPETGLLQRELFWGYTERSSKPQWFPSAMFVYDYKGMTVPQRIYAYAGKQDVLSELPTGAHECWQYTESLRQPEFKFQYSWYGSVVDDLYFITRMDVNAYGTDELFRTCEITDIVVSKHEGDEDGLMDILVGLAPYQQWD